MPVVLKSGSLNLLEPSGPVQACNGIALPLPLPFYFVLGTDLETHLFLFLNKPIFVNLFWDFVVLNLLEQPQFLKSGFGYRHGRSSFYKFSNGFLDNSVLATYQNTKKLRNYLN